MAKNQVSLSQRYGIAFFECLQGMDLKSDIKSYEKTFSEFEVLSQGELGDFLSNPAFEVNEKTEVLKSLKASMGFQDAFHRFLEVLISQDQFAFFSDISKAFKQAVLKHDGKIAVKVTSAFALSEAQTGRVSYAMSQKLGKDVLMQVQVDPELIGGLKAEVGGVVYDASITGQLSSLQKEIKS